MFLCRDGSRGEIFQQFNPDLQEAVLQLREGVDKHHTNQLDEILSVRSGLLS